MENTLIKFFDRLNLDIEKNHLFEIAKLLKHTIIMDGDLTVDKELLSDLKNRDSSSAQRLYYLTKKLSISVKTIKKIIHFIHDMSNEDFSSMIHPVLETYYITATKTLEDLSINLLGKHSAILDCCSGEGSFLANYARISPNSELFGIEIVSETALKCQVNLDLLGHSNQIFNEDALNKNSLFENQYEFDAIYSNFPINLIDRDIDKRLSQRSYFKKHQFKNRLLRDHNWIFPMHIVNLLSDFGKAVVIVPLNMLFRESQVDIRNEFLEKGLIETIIQLPERTLNYTSIPMALMILSNHNEKVRLVDATDAFEPSRRVNHLQVDEILSRMETDGEFSKTISNLELIQNHISWLPRNILLNDAFDYVGQPLENVIQDIFRGVQIKRSEYETIREPLNDTPFTKYQMVSLSSFDESIDPDRLETIYTPKAIYDRYILKNHDILLTSRGTLFKLGLVELDSDENLIATGNVAVLRVDATKINPIYLYMFLKSTKGERLLESIRKGSSILVINNKDVLDLKIPVIPLGKQEALAEKYMRLKEQKTLIQKRLNRMDEDITALYDVAGDI